MTNEKKNNGISNTTNNMTSNITSSTTKRSKIEMVTLESAKSKSSDKISSETWSGHLKEWSDIEFRSKFNEIFKAQFGFDFENWYQSGDISPNYVPHLLLIDNQVVANVSVYLMPMNIEGESKVFAQIGGVVTTPSCRGKGYSRMLMEVVIKKYEPYCDQIFLYCHDQVVEFYKKFGFTETVEYQCYLDIETADSPNGRPIDESLDMFTDEPSDKSNSISSDKGNSMSSDDFNDKLIEKPEVLDLSKDSHLAILREKATYGNPFSAFAMREAKPLVMFYTTYFMNQNVYFLREEELIVIASYEGEVLIINEILGKTTLLLEQIVHRMKTDHTAVVVLGFTPKDETGFEKEQLKEEDTHLMILNKEEEITKKKQWMFPVLSHT